MASHDDAAPPLDPADAGIWAENLVRAQQLWADYAARQAAKASGAAAAPGAWPTWDANPFMPLAVQWAEQSAGFWSQALAGWQAALSGEPAGASDPRFAAADWQENPLFAMVRHSYASLAQQLAAQTAALDGLPPALKAKLQFATQSMIDAAAPTNFALTNPAVIERAVASRGASLVTGLSHLLADLERGQLTHVDRGAFALGRNIAATPGKVVHETALYQLIHYAPATASVGAVPLVIFPPWINRFYILDLNPRKSMVKWLVDQGVSLFMVSWKSADATMADVVWDDYIAAQIDAIDVVRGRLDVAAVHTLGYCVAGTTLAATLAVLAAKGQADRVASATFLTAQVDFELAGELKHFVDDAHLALLDQLAAPGYVDGRVLAAVFNLLRSRDLIWNYVVNHYLLGQEYPAFDLLYWNGDTTNLPAKWHRQYLTDLYRDNRLVVPGSLSALGAPLDLRRIATPAFVQAGRDDHIAPAASVWRIMHHLGGPRTFMLAGSGHIAGVVNPPDAGKYQYWTGDSAAASLEDFVAGATEHPGSWWPYWLEWLRGHDGAVVAATGARVPGSAENPAIEDAPGRYVAN